jgi:hypothetical protein
VLSRRLARPVGSRRAADPAEELRQRLAAQEGRPGTADERRKRTGEPPTNAVWARPRRPSRQSTRYEPPAERNRDTQVGLEPTEDLAASVRVLADCTEALRLTPPPGGPPLAAARRAGT